MTFEFKVLLPFCKFTNILIKKNLLNNLYNSRLIKSFALLFLLLASVLLFTFIFNNDVRG